MGHKGSSILIISFYLLIKLSNISNKIICIVLIIVSKNNQIILLYQLQQISGSLNFM